MAQEGNPVGAAEGKQAERNRQNRDRRTNMLAVLFMAAGTLGASWSAYQSSLWNGRQVFFLNDAAARSRDAAQNATRANQQRAMDAAFFVEYSRDYYEGKAQLAQYFLSQMRSELRELIREWLKTQPMKNPGAPRSPFVMPQYRSRLDDEARDLESKSDELYRQAQHANRTSDTYTLLGVIFTSALFLSGLVSGFDLLLTRKVLLALSFAMLIVALLILARQPVAHPG